MKQHDMTEQAYKNGYEDGYRDGKNRAMEDIAFPKFLARPPEPSKEELEALMNAPATIIKDRESITQIYPYSRWIPVTERLPDNKEHDWVLAQVVEDNGYMHIPKVMEYRQNINDWFEETYGWLSSHNGMFAVTHWMPLPQPPKGE